MKGRKIYIADDQTLFRKGLARLVSSFENVKEVGEAANGKEVLSMIRKSQPDVVLMDLEMPIMDGVEATQKVITRFPKVKIIVLSMHDSHEHIYYLLEQGAHAFLLKNAEPEEVENAINSVIENDFYQNDLAIIALRRGAVAVGQGKNGRPGFQAASSLTEREREILSMICRVKTM